MTRKQQKNEARRLAKYGVTSRAREYVITEQWIDTLTPIGGIDWD